MWLIWFSHSSGCFGPAEPEKREIRQNLPTEQGFLWRHFASLWTMDGNLVNVRSKCAMKTKRQAKIIQWEAVERSITSCGSLTWAWWDWKATPCLIFISRDYTDVYLLLENKKIQTSPIKKLCQLIIIFWIRIYFEHDQTHPWEINCWVLRSQAFLTNSLN